MSKKLWTVSLIAVGMLLFGCRKNTERKHEESVPIQEPSKDADVCEGEVSQTWHEMAPLPQPWAYGCAVNVGDAVYMIGGVTTSDNPDTLEHDHKKFPMPLATILRYDLRDGLHSKWNSFRDMPTPVAGAACVTHDDKIYVMGGYTGEQEAKKNVSLLQIYDTKRDSWSFGPNMNEARLWGAAAVVSGVICVAGGVGKEFSNTVECHDPNRDVVGAGQEWFYTGEFENGRYGLGAIAKDSNILLFGGDAWENGGNTNYDTVHVFSPGTGASKVLYRLEQATSAIIGTQLQGKAYIYIQGHIWDASSPYGSVLKIGAVPATPEEFDRVYHGFAYPGVVAIEGGVMILGGGSSSKPSTNAKVFCIE